MKSKDWRPTAFVETAPGVVTEVEAEAHRLARRRELLALLRRLLALDAAALLLTVALVGRAFAQPVQQRGAVALAIAAFLAGAVAAGVALFSALPPTLRIGAPHPPARGTRPLAAVALGVFVAFAFGLGALALFFFANWFR